MTPATGSAPSATRWVALLRGVNVGGATVRSADLAALFRELGFGAVKTVLATGNVAFDCDVPPDAGAPTVGALKERIERALSDRFGYDAWIVLLTRDALTAAAGGYPFARRDEVEHPYVVFGATDAVLDELLAESLTALAASGSDTEDISRGAGCLYWRLPRGHSTDTAVAKVTAKQKYRSGTTTRNLRTVEKISVA